MEVDKRTCWWRPEDNEKASYLHWTELGCKLNRCSCGNAEGFERICLIKDVIPCLCALLHCHPYQPRLQALYPVIQCYMLKNGRAWYATSRALHDVNNALMNVGVETTPSTQKVSAKTSTIVRCVNHFNSAYARASFLCVLWNYMAPMVALRFRFFFEIINLWPGKREWLSLLSQRLDVLNSGDQPEVVHRRK